jgi:hypothetical protein
MTRMLRARFRHGLLAVLTAVTLAGCGAVDVQSALEITDVRTGWYDEGVVLGQNKLVPSISLRLQNISDANVQGIQLNAVFHRVIETEEPPLGDHFVQAIDREGLAPGEAGDPLVLRSGFGYTGQQSRLEMLQNRFFVDARVEIYAKSGSRPWTLLGEFPIERTLLTE